MTSSSRIVSIYADHRTALVAYAQNIMGDGMLAEDLVQDAWVRFDRASRKKEIKEPVGYLYRIVRNLAFDQAKRAVSESEFVEKTGDASLERVIDETTSPGRSAVAREELRLLQEALAELPKRTQVAIEMKRYGDFKLREIAAHLGVSVTVAHELVAEGIAYCRERVRAGK
ncbi:MAG: sigma-70 family RNA polymerase sigma factor [Verrucomicrobiota bacterium]